MIDIQELLKHPEMLNKDSLYELRNMLAHYPYFEVIRLLYLKNLYILHDPSFGEELNKSVIYITDRSFLYHYIEGEFKYHYTKKESVDDENKGNEDRTLSLINAFLASMPEESNYAAIGNGVATDYASYLLEKKDGDENVEVETPLRGQNLIDKFIEEADKKNFFMHQDEKKGEIDSSRVEEDEDLDDDSYFTETLAKIYIKQERYSKALEIIKKLSLKYPKKNAYFADQIKFLENQIINAKSKK